MRAATCPPRSRSLGRRRPRPPYLPQSPPYLPQSRPQSRRRSSRSRPRAHRNREVRADSPPYLRGQSSGHRVAIKRPSRGHQEVIERSSRRSSRGHQEVIKRSSARTIGCPPRWQWGRHGGWKRDVRRVHTPVTFTFTVISVAKLTFVPLLNMELVDGGGGVLTSV